MSYGMSYDDFWYGDVRMHRAYREAHKISVSEKNMYLWLQGRYVYEAIGAMVPVLRAFSKARKPNEYPDHPYDLFAEERKRREEREARARYERIKEKVAMFADEFNKRRKETSERKEVENA